MPRQWRRLQPWPLFVAMAFCAFTQPSFAIDQEASATALLDQAESLRTIDNPRFLRLLEEIRQSYPHLSVHEHWKLRYLEAWQASFQGDYAHADPLLQDVIDHAGDPALVAKASAVLIDDMGSNKRYGEAFELANRLVADLPNTEDKLARFFVLFYVSQLLRSAGQYELAANYASQALALSSGEAACPATALLLTVRYESHKLTSTSPELQQGINICQAANEPVYMDSIWLLKSSLYLDEDQPGKTVALLQRIAPSVRSNHYYANMLASQVELAQAYLKLGDDASARRAALAALALSDPDDISESLRDTYQVLYLLDKKHGDSAAALANYEHYVTQNNGYLNDISARALAYAMAQQHMLVQKFETEKLSRQNNILRLQQALDTKAVEAGRLYIALLLMVLASVIFWLFRLRRSQLRFKKLSRHDGLTAIYNHQHFVSEADHALQLLEKKAGAACLVSIDLDYFKQINDTHGHAVGDAVLRHTVALCRLQLRPGDLFGRLGGEEFGILLVGCARDQGKAIADRIRMAIESSPVNEDGCVVSFSASIGMASTDTSGYELQRLRREADAALYRAKRTGRNRVIADTQGDGLVGV